MPEEGEETWSGRGEEDQNFRNTYSEIQFF